MIVNTEALDLGLGSGGFDVVHANLTRGLAGGGAERDRVMKLNYSSLQHPVRARGAGGRRAEARRRRPFSSSRFTVISRPRRGRRPRRAPG